MRIQKHLYLPLTDSIFKILGKKKKKQMEAAVRLEAKFVKGKGSYDL